MEPTRALLDGPRRVGAAAVALVAFGGFVGLGVAVAGLSRPIGFDSAVRDALDAGFSRGVADGLADLGSAAVVGSVTVVAAAIFLARRRWRAALLLGLAPVVAVVLVEVVAKPLVGRTMPPSAVTSGGLAYPSGHAAAVTALAAGVLVAVLGPGRWGSPRQGGPGRRGSRLARAGVGLVTGVAIAAVLGCAAGLVGAGYHYATDTLGGIALAVVTVIGLVFAIDLGAGAGAIPGRPRRAPRPAAADQPVGTGRR